MPRPGWAERQGKKSAESMWNLPWYLRRALLLERGLLKLYLAPVGAPPYSKVGVLEESAARALRRLTEWNAVNRRLPNPLNVTYVEEFKVVNVSRDDVIAVLRQFGVLVLDGELK